MVDTDVLTSAEIGFDEKEIGLMILGNYYAIIVTIRQAKKTGQFGGYVMLFWGSEGPPHGQRWWLQML